MKLIVMIIVAILFNLIAAQSKGDSCDANSCQSCANSNCVWCDNRCIDKNSKISCTRRISDKKECNDNKQKGCDYKGKKYDIGEEFMDDCNSCTCKKSGHVSCSLNICFGCDSVDCQEGTFCIEINNRPFCKPIDDPCKQKNCGINPDFKCFINEYGSADCIPDPCKKARCGSGKICVIRYDGTAGCVSPTCKYNGKTYNHGQSFPSNDGCNHCYCNDGNVICTLMACAPTCQYGSKIYYDGQSWPDSDGCNTCSCNAGQIACTDKACESCQSDDDCDYDSFCLISGCSDLLQGICTECNPDIKCTLQRLPVCGCNGKTYDNDCEARRACVSFKPGECCFLHEDCDDQFYCAKESCNDYDLGVCTKLPLCTGIYQDDVQVCGCNYISYDNECLANKAGVNVKNIGDCIIDLPFD